MAVRLRLMRLGRKGQPFYRIVAVDSRKRRDGSYLEKIGHYNPNARPAEVLLDDQKALKWLGQGAIPSDTVRSLLSRYGIMMAFDLAKKGVNPEEINMKMAEHRQMIEGKLQSEAKEVAAAKAAKAEAVAAADAKAASAAAKPEAAEESAPATEVSEGTPTENPAE